LLQLCLNYHHMSSSTSLWMVLLKISLIFTLHIQQDYQESPCAPSLYMWGTDFLSCIYFMADIFWNSLLFGCVPTLEKIRVKSQMGKYLKTWPAFRLTDPVAYLVHLKEIALWYSPSYISLLLFLGKSSSTHTRAIW
jgi:hypothetical protein